ncbi:MAG: hypothetical protein LBT39_03135 [Treponema sp.]|jgi:hypothetical protein|nr:hypothetical protein [Treponema sp.]
MEEPQAELWPAIAGKKPPVVKLSTAKEGRTVLLPADEIADFIASPRKPGEYISFVVHLFKDVLGLPPEDKVWDLLAHLEGETDFYTAPASTRYHGAEPCGLMRHSLLVLANGIQLAPLLLGEGADNYYLTVSCFFHDLCKVNMYEQKMRNVKNEKTGEWEKEPFYSVKADYIAFGHGIESLLRITRFIDLPPSWMHAVRWHMGAYDISPLDKFAMEKALAKYKEVLFLQTADMQAGVVAAV